MVDDCDGNTPVASALVPAPSTPPAVVGVVDDVDDASVGIVSMIALSLETFC